jgi:anti-sigma factor RsiW
MTQPSAECRDLLEGISAYLDGELDATACDAIERHCTNCPQCARLIAGLRETVGLCRGAATTPLPESVKARAQASIRKLLGDVNPH